MTHTRTLGLVALVSTVVGAGCGKAPAPSATVVATTRQARQADQHAHERGLHGGLIAEIGKDDKYHAEVTFEKNGVVKIYTLGRNETEVECVELQTLEAHAQAEGEADGYPVQLHPLRQKRDPQGLTSAFRGQLPPELVGRTVTLTVPITIHGRDYRFRVVAQGGSHEGAKPAVSSSAGVDEEMELYLKPGGRYTEADIQANGAMTAARKFQGTQAAHDMYPKPGDKVCPITRTKANPKFTWIVDGKAYQFCCPPCVDEFVSMAKEQPDHLKPPEEYIKK